FFSSRRRHTSFSRDWSSDVCSSDLTEQPQTPSRLTEITATLRGKTYRFYTDTGVFSRRYVDRGTQVLVEAMEVPPAATVLDMGRSEERRVGKERRSLWVAEQMDGSS